jgi:6,7-dimethyl-8-ribityllumazine synthase
MKIAIVVSKFNAQVTDGLLQGALQYCSEKNITKNQIDIFHVPGSFEIPLVASRLAKTGRYKGVVCLGCVIKGDTAHFELVSLGATMGILTGMLNTDTPIAFGVLTTYTDEQAELRCQNNTSNKGYEAAAACFETIEVLQKIDSPLPVGATSCCSR